MEFKYLVCKTNKFDVTVTGEVVAKFKSLELAKDFVNYQISIGNNFGILENGVRIDLEDYI